MCYEIEQVDVVYLLGSVLVYIACYKAGFAENLIYN